MKRLVSGSTLTAYLVSTKSLVQNVTGGTGVNVDWTTDSPIVYPQVRSSASTAFITSFKKTTWYYDNVIITGEDERFEITTYRVGSADLPALKIKANLGLEIESKKLIYCEMTVDAGGYDDTVSADIEVSRQDSSPSTYIGEVGVTNGGVITTEVAEVTLTASLFQGGQGVGAYEVEWMKIVANDTEGEDDGLVSLGKTGKQITLSRDEVDLMQTILARFKVSGSVVASVRVDVRDETDPYEMIFEFSNPGGVVDKTNGCTTTVKVVTAHTTTVIPTFTMYAFALFNGLTKIREQAKSSSNSFKTNYSDLADNNVTELRLEVEASES